MTRIMTAVLIILLGVPGLAQQEDDWDDFEELPETETSGGGVLGFGGGISGTWHFMDIGILNSELQLKGFPALPTEGMFMFGGHGYIYIVVVPNLRVGGIGAAGSFSATETSNLIYRSVELSTGFGGATIEYVFPFKRFQIAVGGMLGGGSHTLTLTRTPDADKSWPLLPSSGSTRDKYSNAFFAWQPQLTLEYMIHPLAMLSLSGGYFGTSGNKWELNDHFDVADVPDFKLGKAYVRLALTVGLFMPE